MELIKQQLLYRKKTVETILQAEESIDSIIPDTLSDVERILDVSALVMVREKQPRQDALSIRLHAVVTVLYLPENDNTVSSVQIPMTFSIVDTVENITPASELLCIVSDSHAQARMINPRKLSVQLSAAVKVSSYDNVRELITTGVSGDGSADCETLSVFVDSLETTTAVSKTFQVSDEVTYPLPAEQTERILDYRAEPLLLEIKSVNHKVAVKGEICVSSLALTSEHKLSQVSFSVPFTQIMDVNGATETSQPQVRLSLKNFDVVPTNDVSNESHMFVVTAGLYADILITETVKREILMDLYSTKELLSVSSELYHYAAVCEGGNVVHSVRETIELGSSAIELAKVSLSMPCDLIVPSDEDEWMIPVVLDLIFADENGSYQAASRRIYAKPGAIRAGCYRLTHSPVVAQVGSDATVSVSFDFTISPNADVIRTIDQIADVTECGKLEPKDDSSVLIRRIEVGDTFWDIAKKYHVAGVLLKEVNRIQQDLLPVGSMLVIPMFR